jgi:hypothetical protein
MNMYAGKCLIAVILGEKKAWLPYNVNFDSVIK